MLEAGRRGFEAYGFEINPAAWILSKTYELMNDPHKMESVKTIRSAIDREFPFRIFDIDEPVQDWEPKLKKIRNQLNQEATDFTRSFNTVWIWQALSGNYRESAKMRPGLSWLSAINPTSWESLSTMPILSKKLPSKPIYLTRFCDKRENLKINSEKLSEKI
ncbi:MAG: hypothetical protein ACP5D7_09240 [Limnospira sp.]